MGILRFPLSADSGQCPELYRLSLCWKQESNLRPTRYECVALPTDYSSRIKYCFRLRLLETLLFLKEQHMVEILRISLATDSKQCFELYRLSYSSRIKYCFRLRLLETLLFLKEQHIVKILRISLATDSKQCFQTLPFYFTQKLAV